MSDKNSWDEMMCEWQACKIAEISDSKELQDIKKLKDKTRKKARNMKFFMWGDILGAIVMVCLFAYQLTQDTHLYLLALFGGSLLIILPMAFLSVWYRKGAWSTTGNDTKAYLLLALRRNMAAIKLAKASKITAMIAGTFFLSIVVMRGYSEQNAVQWPWNKYVFGAVLQIIIFSAMYFGSKWHLRKKQDEQVNLQEMLGELKD